MKILKKIVICLGILLGCMYIPCFADLQSCTYLVDGKGKTPSKTSIAFDKNKYNGGKTINNLTKYFCESVSSFKCIDSRDGDDAIDYFDASQSMFLSILCESVQKGQSYTRVNSFLNKKSFLDFGFDVNTSTGYQGDCHRRGNMNNCNYAYYLPQIFNRIMNDLFSIKQARYFGISSIQDSFSAKDVANAFFTGKFFGLDLQEGLENGVCSDNSPYYKKTCKKLESYISDAYNLLKNTEIINVKLLQAQGGDEVDCKNNFIGNIAYCGLLNDNSDYKFINVVYNEYFWYKLFLSYYTFYINGKDFLDNTYLDDEDVLDENMNKIASVDSYSDDENKLKKNMEKISLVEDQLLKSKQAITLSLRTLSEISYSFPLHVGFLMYHEDAQLFMENIVKIYPPIRTLYDKLRNVQIKES